MLERASSCLEAGGRQLLQGTKRSVRSRRMLHSAFWHHGAGDLSLPIWWASVIPSTPGRTTEHGEPSHCGEKLCTDGVYNGQNDLLLDFLYPAKTMALIKRISSCGWEAWHSRRRRQFARNKVRQYSSRSSSIQEYVSNNFGEITASEEAQEVQELKQTLQTSDALDALQALLQSKGKGRQGLAWRLYGILDESERAPTLRADLLNYLALSEHPVHASRSLQVFDSLLPESRRASSYRAAISGHLKLHMVGRAVRLHDEAADRAVGHRFGTDVLLARTVQDNQWDLAIHVFQTFMRFWDRKGLPGEYPHLWTVVSQLPMLFSNAVSLLQFAKQFRYDFQSTTEKPSVLESFMAGIVPKVIDRAVAAPDLDEAFIRGFFRVLLSLGLSTKDYYENILFKLLSLQQYRNYSHRPKLHLHLYAEYRDEAVVRDSRDGFYPSQNLIMAFMKLMASHYSFKPYPGARTTVSSLTSDWHRFHGHLTRNVLLQLMNSYARAGDAERVHEYFQELRTQEPGPLKNHASLWPLLHVHSRRLEISAVHKQFERISEEFGLKPDIVSWNILLHTYARADDLDGTLKCFDDLVKSGLRPDSWSFGPVLDICARRGDVEAVQGLFAQARSENVLIQNYTVTRAALVLANVNSDDLATAEAAAGAMLKDKRAGTLHGPLTPTWNILLTTYAARSDLESTMRIYRSMQAEKIPLDSLSYSALMKSLIVLRQTDAAYKILRKTMVKNNIRACAHHYALVMAGFISEFQVHRALKAHERMISKRIRPTVSSRMAYLKAKAFAEVDSIRHKLHGNGKRGEIRLVEVEEGLREILAESDPSDYASKQPRQGLHGMPLNQVSPDGYFEFLIMLYGTRGAYKICQELIEVAAAARHDEYGNYEAPLGLLTALMNAHCYANKHEEVDKCWNLARAQVAKLVKLLGSDPVKLPTASGTPPIESAPTVEAPPVESLTGPRTEGKEKIAPNRRDLLARPIRIYMRSILMRNDSRKVPKVQQIISSLIADGYVLDNLTWNEFIQVLARSGHMVDAFTACEAYLMPNFIGWRCTNPWYRRRNVPGYERMDVRPIDVRNKRTLMPRYKTLVIMGAALAHVRRAEGAGRGYDPEDTEGHLLPMLEQLAPKTIRAIETMPVVPDDNLQRKYWHEM
ncbi:uncharacterized protein K441DRAFT_700266 [Cenococcum geophilum 1.58]|uniref:uncharacterized protein n=1 Tax=Cenococcum geophilum 1.58 TaxID=794803 RepID=UPI00358F1004|nr:hypothetical protein K441DRAFT_700266 [Cenococcum geophilum 1.58]